MRPLLIVALLAAPTMTPAYETGINLQHLIIAPEQDRLFWSDGSELLGSGDVAASMYLHFTDNPLSLVRMIGDQVISDEPAVDHQLYGDLGLAIGIMGTTEIQVTLPITLLGSGDTDSFAAVEDAGIGDVRVRLRIRLLERARRKGGHGLAMSLDLSLPLGDPTSLATDPSPTFAVRGSHTYQAGAVLSIVNLGVRLRGGGEPLENLAVGHELLYSAGMRYRVMDTLDLGGELFGRISLEDPSVPNAPLELAFGPRYAFAAGWTTEAAVGVGLVSGYGTPDVRLLLGIQYAAPRKYDADKDGIMDDRDQCPNEPEDLDGFEDADGCPDPDNDKDGILDGDDKCPNDPEDFDGFQDLDGCPDPDNDGDRVLDKKDKCPNKAEDFDEFEDEDGCPDPDNDKDGILDGDDQCPNEPETMNGFKDDDGCPDEKPAPPPPPVVQVQEKRLLVLEKIHFEYNRSTLKPESHGILNQIALALLDHPEVLLVEVGGHTDRHGTPGANKVLSQRRVEVVCAFLFGAGVQPDRLIPVGYGESMPLTDGGNEFSRSTNRRVEFKILKRLK